MQRLLNWEDGEYRYVDQDLKYVRESLPTLRALGSEKLSSKAGGGATEASAADNNHGSIAKSFPTESFLLKIQRCVRTCTFDEESGVPRLDERARTDQR